MTVPAGGARTSERLSARPSLSPPVARLQDQLHLGRAGGRRHGAGRPAEDQLGAVVALGGGDGPDGCRYRQAAGQARDRLGGGRQRLALGVLPRKVQRGVVVLVLVTPKPARQHVGGLPRRDLVRWDLDDLGAGRGHLARGLGAAEKVVLAAGAGARACGR